MKTQDEKKKQSNSGSAKKELLIAEAEKIFAEKGFHETSIRDIAKATGSNVALIYYYFKDKEDLYLHILDETFRQMTEHIQKSLKDGADDEERLRLVIKAYISFMGTRTHIPRIMAREMAEGGQYVAIIMERYVFRNFSMMQGILNEGAEKGVFNKVDLELTPLCMMGMMGFFFFASPMIKRILKRSDYDSEFLERLSSTVTDVFFNGVKKRETGEE